MPERFHYEIETAERDLNSRKEEYVQRWGWKRTCNTPGSFWLWVRDFRKEDNERIDNWRDRGGKGTRPEPYGIMKVPLDLAVRMTVMSLDEQPECNEEENNGQQAQWAGSAKVRAGGRARVLRDRQGHWDAEDRSEARRRHRAGHALAQQVRGEAGAGRAGARRGAMDSEEGVMNALAFLILAGILAFVIWPRQFGRECRILCDKFMEGWRDP